MGSLDGPASPSRGPSPRSIRSNSRSNSMKVDIPSAVLSYAGNSGKETLRGCVAAGAGVDAFALLSIANFDFGREWDDRCLE